jgi:DNA polymerase-1
MPLVLAWLQKTRDEAVKLGFLTTPMGRMRRFGLITDKNVFEIRNQASNFPVSSTASDICLTALMGIHEEFKRRKIAKILLMVHDSILSECRVEDAPEVEQIMQRHMEAAPVKVIPDCTVPFKVDSHVGLRWGDLA